MDLHERYEEILQRVARAAERSGRPSSAVTMIAVTKTLPAERVRAAFGLGIRDIGENRVQELLEKKSELTDLPIRWHLIGHLQSNKVKRILPHVVLIHSVDSLPLGAQIDRLAAGGQAVDLLLEVNTSGEATKFGVAPGEVRALASAVRGLNQLRVRGLMTLGPLTEDPAAIRASFRMLRELLDAVREEIPDASVLSMGMSGDFEIAIEEGATHIRVGTALFGSRA